MAVRDKTCIIYLMKDDTVGRVAKKWQLPCKMFQNDTLGGVGMKARKTIFFQEIAKKRHFF